MTPHDVLRVKPDATPEEVRTAFYRLAKTWHPDRFQGQEKEDAERKFRELVHAFNTLNRAHQGSGKPYPGSRDSFGGTQRGAEPPISQAREPDDWFREAHEARAGGDAERALGLAYMAIRGNARKAEYYLLYADLMQEIGGDPHDAIRALETALELKPSHVEILIKLATRYQDAGMPARASALLQKARELAPHHRHFRLEAKQSQASLRASQDFWNQVKSLTQRLLHPG